MSPRGKLWSKMIEESGIKVRLYTRPGGTSVYYSLHLDGKKVQKSIGLRDRKQAETYVRQVVGIIAEDRTAGRFGSPTMGRVFTIYFREKAPLLRESWRHAAETRRELFEKIWGADQNVDDIGQTQVDRFVAARRTGGIVLAATDDVDERVFRAVRDGSIDGDFRWLSTVFNWARKHKTNGRRLISANPLHDVEWPKEKRKNIRQPIASHERFVKTLEVADAVDPSGRLGCMLSLARYTGHRENAICQLRVSDFLRTPESMAAALAAIGQDESRAADAEYGAIRWRGDSDKQGVDHIAEIGPRARAALIEYLNRNPRLGEAFLFPSPREPQASIRKDGAGRWLMKAEKLAGLPKLAGGRWHPYRRLWATEKKHLPAQDVAALGGWNDTQALTLLYQKSDAKTVRKVVEMG